MLSKSIENNNRIDTVNLIKKTNEFTKCPSMKSLVNSQSNSLEANLATCLSNANLPPSIPNRRTHGSTFSVSSTSNCIHRSSQDLSDHNENNFCDSPM